MNNTAAEIGMNNTSFSIPNGLDTDDYYSTVYIIAMLTAEGLNNEIIRLREPWRKYR